ncbi:MAG: hypothetical protein VYB93_03545 [Pseudomonadota bacterium]|nr:hypothetical protein [Pseudomonadota bacterium]
MNNPKDDFPPPDRLVPLREALPQVGYRSRTSLYRDLRDDDEFPAPIYRGRNVFFLQSELTRYVRELADRARAGEQTHKKLAGQEVAARLVDARKSKAMVWRELREARLASQGAANPSTSKSLTGGAK